MTVPVYGQQMGFGSGVLIASSKNSSGVITPRRFGILQDVQLDFSADLKELYGQGRYAIALAPGKTKIEIKSKFAEIRGALFNDLYFGATTQTTGVTRYADQEAHNIAATTPFIATVTNSTTFVADQGVYYALTGLPLTAVASAPMVGQYSVAAGVYTFNTADEGLGVYISYTYTTATGLLIPISNIAMGTGPVFQIVLNQPFDSRNGTFVFNNCRASKLSLPTKQDDFMINELDFMPSADPSGNIGTISLDL